MGLFSPGVRVSTLTGVLVVHQRAPVGRDGVRLPHAHGGVAESAERGARPRDRSVFVQLAAGARGRYERGVSVRLRGGGLGRVSVYVCVFMCV